jgi:uncharacterized membrane protein YdcZ (DUF606 family)
MMIYLFLFPLLIGAFGVLQNTVNKKVGDVIGLPSALVINNLVLLGCSLLLFFALRLAPEGSLPELFRQKGNFTDYGWKTLLPGLFGFFIITTAPWAIDRAGAARVFIGIIVAQVLVSLLWDYYAESIPVSPTRLAGAALALAGALLAVR